MFVKWKLEHTPIDDSSASGYGTTTTLTEFFNPILNMKIGDGKDSFNFEIINYNKTYDTFFNPNDKMIISRIVNSTSLASSDVIMNGAIRDVPEQITYSKNNIKLTGYNYSETIMGAIIPILDATTLNSAEAIQQGLIIASANNTNFSVIWDSNNPSTKEDGTAFPSVGKVFYYKTLKDIIEEVTSKDYTNDGKYYWYVNQDNNLIWDKRIDNATDTFNDSTDNFSRLKVSKDINDVKNFIIMKGGRDAKSSPVSFPAADYASIGKHGFKYYVYTSSNIIGDNLIEVDAKSDTINGDSVQDIIDFFDTSGSYTVPWLIDGVANTYTTFKDYNDGLRTYIKQELSREGSSLLEDWAFGTLSVSIDRSPLEGMWYLGNVITCSISTLGDIAKNLRVEEVQYTTLLDTYVLKEDEGSI